jgi:C1A family cysteine protease
MPSFKLTWKPDSTQPLPAGQVAHVDPKFADNLHLFGLNVQPLNGVLDLRRWCAPVDDQGDISDCVAESTTTALELLEISAGLSFVKKSRLFVYYNARLSTNQVNKDDGTFIRSAFGSLTTLGTCAESTWSYDSQNVFTRPSWSAYREAFPNKINSYYRIDADDIDTLVEAFQRALAAGHPICFGMTVDQKYMDTGSDGMVAMPDNKRDNAGGHAQCIVGCNTRLKRLIVKNSWSRAWGDNGYGYVPYDYLDVSDANDFWVPYRMGTHPTDTSDVTVTVG